MLLLAIGLGVASSAGGVRRAGAEPSRADGEPVEPVLVNPRVPAVALSLQAGWWNIELDARTRLGIFADLGVPWAGVVLGEMSSGTAWVVPVAAKLGYEHRLTSRLGLRGGVRLAYLLSSEDPCGAGCDHLDHRVFGFVEVGVRWELPSGLVAGLDIPLFAVSDLADTPEPMGPPASLAFAQGYLGWRFR